MFMFSLFFLFKHFFSQLFIALSEFIHMSPQFNYLLLKYLLFTHLLVGLLFLFSDLGVKSGSTLLGVLIYIFIGLFKIQLFS